MPGLQTRLRDVRPVPAVAAAPAGLGQAGPHALTGSSSNSNSGASRNVYTGVTQA